MKMNSSQSMKQRCSIYSPISPHFFFLSLLVPAPINPPHRWLEWILSIKKHFVFDESNPSSVPENLFEWQLGSKCAEHKCGREKLSGLKPGLGLCLCTNCVHRRRVSGWDGKRWKLICAFLLVLVHDFLFDVPATQWTLPPFRLLFSLFASIIYLHSSLANKLSSPALYVTTWKRDIWPRFLWSQKISQVAHGSLANCYFSVHFKENIL